MTAGVLQPNGVSPSVGQPYHKGVNGLAEAMSRGGDGVGAASSWLSAQVAKAESQLLSLLKTQQK